MTTNQNKTRRSGQLKLLAIVAVFALPLVAAALWYFIAPMTAPGTTAHGELIEPVKPLEAFESRNREGARFTLEELEGKWHIIHVIDAGCDADCRERIYYTRQIRTALGHERDRVRRLLLVTDPGTLADLDGELADHPDLLVLDPAGIHLLVDQFPRQRTAETVFLVDPLGNLMMRFDADVAPRDILSDIEKLLRVSRIG